MICFRGEHWLRLCDAMGRPELKADERFARTKDRARNMDEVDALVEQWTRTLTKAEIFVDCAERWHDLRASSDP